MKRHLASLALIVVVAALSGCYYDPGYSYVRSSGQGGDAYYGRAESIYYAAPGYYDSYSGSGYYGNEYYGSGYYGCCYGPTLGIGISSRYYGGSRYGSYGYRGYRGRDHGDRGRRHDDRGRHHDNRGRHGRGTQNSQSPYGGRPTSDRPQGNRQQRDSSPERETDDRGYRH